MQNNFQSFHPKIIKQRVEEERPRQSASQQDLRSPFFNQSPDSDLMFKSKINSHVQEQKSPLNVSQKTAQRIIKDKYYIVKEQTPKPTSHKLGMDSHRSSNTQYLKNPSQNISIETDTQPYQNSKFYNLDDSQVRLTQINQRMQDLKERRVSPEVQPFQKDIIKRDIQIESLQQENELLRNAVSAYLTQKQLFPFLEQFGNIQQIDQVDLYTLATYTRNEMSSMSERQIIELKEQITQSIQKINEQDQEKASLRQRINQIQQQSHDSEQSRADLEYRNGFLLNEVCSLSQYIKNERLHQQNRDQIEIRQKTEEESFRSIQQVRVPLKNKENCSPKILNSDRKVHELNTQLSGLGEKVKKDEHTIKQLQDVNYKLQLELDGKHQSDLKVVSLMNQNQNLQKELTDIIHQVDETRNRAERERDIKQQEFKQVFEELSKYRSESRILKDENSWLQNQKAALEEQYQKTIGMYNDVVLQRKNLLDEKDELLIGLEDIQDQHQMIVEQMSMKSNEEQNELRVHQNELRGQLLQSENKLKSQEDTINDTQSQLKKYKKSILQLHEMLPFAQVQEQSARYESLNHYTILENLQSSIARMLYSMGASVELQENLKHQEEERSQVIYDMQNQLADINQQHHNVKLLNSKLDKQYKLVKIEYQKVRTINKTLKKEYEHQKSVAEQYLQDTNSKNDDWQKVQIKLKDQFDQILMLERQVLVSENNKQSRGSQYSQKSLQTTMVTLYNK